MVFRADVAYVVLVCFPLPHGENVDDPDGGRGTEEDSLHMEENTEVRYLVRPVK